MKTAGGFRRIRYRGMDGTGLASYLVATGYNLVGMAKLLSVQGGEQTVGSNTPASPLPIIPKLQSDASASSRSSIKPYFAATC